MKNLFTLFGFLLWLFTLSGQETYIYKYGSNGEDVGSIYQRMNDTLYSLLVTTLPGEPIFGDIAVGQDGTIYGLTQGGNIRQIGLATGTTIEVGSFSVLSAHTAFTADAESNFYTLDFFNNLYAYNVISQEETFILEVGEITPGDLAFYRGKLVYPTDDGFIKAIDLESLEITIIYCFPDEIIEMASVFGITNSFNSCGEEQLLVSNTNNDVFLIDVENNTYEHLDIEYLYDSGGSIYGLASSNDVLSSECNETITEVDCVVGLVEEELTSRILIYPNPASDLLTLDNIEEVEQVVITDIRGATVLILDNPDKIISTSQLTNGSYFLSIHLRNGIIENHHLIIRQ